MKKLETVYSIKSENILELIEKHTGISEIFPGFNETILSILHKLPGYQEESNIFSFRLFIGKISGDIQINLDNTKAKFIPIKKDISDNSKLKCALADTAVLCSGDYDLCVIINDDNLANVGIINSSLANAVDSDYELLNSKFIIFEPYSTTVVLIRTASDIQGLRFDLRSEDIKVAFDNTVNNKEKIWTAIFDKVKREVHGTICLIVEPECDLNQGTFKEKPDVLPNDIIIDISDGNPDINKLNEAIDLFIKMLNYDGITIIDTNGKIIAYHVFVDVEKKNNEDKEYSNTSPLLGGARSRAYDTLKKQRCKGYVAIYFQSQEGIIKTYIYPKEYEESEKEISGAFISEIMEINPMNKPDIIPDKPLNLVEANGKEYKDVNYYANLEIENFTSVQICPDDVQPGDTKGYTILMSAITELHSMHLGFNNFHTEPKAAKIILKILNSHPNFIECLKKYKNLSAMLINVLLECFVGNHYGISNAAEPVIIDIIKIIPDSCWQEYFSSKRFLDPAFINTIIVMGRTYRFKDLLVLLREKGITEYSSYLFNLEDRILYCLVRASNLREWEE